MFDVHTGRALFPDCTFVLSIGLILRCQSVKDPFLFVRRMGIEKHNIQILNWHLRNTFYLENRAKFFVYLLLVRLLCWRLGVFTGISMQSGVNT